MDMVVMKLGENALPSTHPKGWKTALENLRSPSFTLQARSANVFLPETSVRSIMFLITPAMRACYRFSAVYPSGP
jgi:hypothetical protein